MKKILNLKKNNFNLVIDITLEVLKNDGVVIYPTDTLYGLGTNALNETNLKRIFLIKKRKKTKTLPILIGSKNQLKSLGIILTKTEEKLVNNFWPGELTLVLKSKKNFCNLIQDKNNCIAIRIPDNNFMLVLLNKLPFPITGTSVNISEKISVCTIKEIPVEIIKKADLVIDGGKCPASSGSTVIKVEKNKIIFYREGDLSKEEILKVINSGK